MTKIENFEFIFRTFKCSTHGLESLEGELNFCAGSVTTFSRLITQGFGNLKFWLLEFEFSTVFWWLTLNWQSRYTADQV